MREYVFFGRDKETTPSRSTENTHPSSWKTKQHTYKHRLRQPYAREDGSALALTRDLRRRFLKKRLYTRVITDSGSELLAKDKRGHWRRVRAY